MTYVINEKHTLTITMTALSDMYRYITVIGLDLTDISANDLQHTVLAASFSFFCCRFHFFDALLFLQFFNHLFLATLSLVSLDWKHIASRE